ncbi:FliM/FliN family flagellar motor switch protein [Pseudooceanicola sp. 502str34]
MGKTSSNAVLRRKTLAAREGYQARVLSPDKALRLALARAADEALDLALAVRRLEVDELPLEDAVAELPEAALTLLLEGPEGLSGAMSLDFALMSSLVEMQTMGRLLRSPPDPRRPTRTDAALTAPLIDAAFTALEGLLEASEEGYWLTGYRFGAMMEGPRMLGLALDAGGYHRLRLELDLAGQREGGLQILLPEREKPRAAPLPEEAGDGPPMARVVGQARAELTAELHRLSLPWEALLKLKPGDVLPIPRAALGSTMLLGPGRQRVLKVRLGQMNGARAVRLSAEEGARTARRLSEAGEAAEPRAEAPAMAAASTSPPAPEPEVAEPPPDVPDPSPRVEALEDLPDLSDLPGLGPQEEDLEPLPMSGFPMADLSDFE